MGEKASQCCDSELFEGASGIRNFMAVHTGTAIEGDIPLGVA